MSATVSNNSLAIAANNTLIAVIQVNHEAVLFTGFQGNWSRVEVIDNIAAASGSLLFSSHPRRNQGFLTTAYAFTLEGPNLKELQNAQDQGWFRVNTVSRIASSVASCIWSDFPVADGTDPNRELLVLEGSNVVHYWKVSGPNDAPWNRGVTVSSRATAAPIMIMSSYRADTNHPHNFEALILEGNNLVHYWRDNSAPGLPWHRDQIVSTMATGPASMIEGPYGSPGNFEALVPEGRNIVHYWRDNSTAGTPWRRGVTVSSSAIGPACLGQSGNRASTNFPGNFEALISETTGVFHYWRDNSAPGLPWHKAARVAA